MKSGKFKKAVSFFALASVFTMAGCQKDEVLEEVSANSSLESDATASAIEGQYIVVLKEGGTLSSSQIRERVLGATGISRERISSIQGDETTGSFTGSLQADEVKSLRKNPSVAYVEADQAVSLARPKTPAPTAITSTTSTTTSTQTIPWGVARVGYGDGTGKTVWVIDSGVDTDHPDLNVDLTRSKSFISGVTSIEDGYGHGTAVSGIIGAKNNNIGVVGVAANATIVALRVFDDTGYGTLTRIYSALNYAYTNGKAGDVINMSLRVNASTLLDDLVKKAAAKGMFIAIAAGNSSIDCLNDSPARVNATNVYTVSSMGSDSKFSSFSNFGAAVDFSAPGAGIQSTTKNGGYMASGSGTSYAAPHLAGLLALKGKSILTQGFVTGDPDGKPDPIARK